MEYRLSCWERKRGNEGGSGEERGRGRLGNGGEGESVVGKERRGGRNTERNVNGGMMEEEDRE